MGFNRVDWIPNDFIDFLEDIFNQTRLTEVVQTLSHEGKLGTDIKLTNARRMPRKQFHRPSKGEA